ncbi:MAG TPA: hypothetical protein VJC21_03610 [Candidatus Nanoarchaeia archaeon]|nr:hypothetical protein [Candidatus Nanoarchaeia archaeon]
MIVEIVLLVAIILNLGAMSVCAFQRKKNLLLILAALETILAIIFAVLAGQG